MKAQIKQIIYQAIAENNMLLAHPIDMSRQEKTELFGSDGQLDSMSLVSLIVSIEEALENKFGKSILLASEKAMSQRRSPFVTVGSLVDYTEQLLQEVA